MKTDKLITIASLVLVVNAAYAVGNLLVGVSDLSWWFITLGIYYIILSTMRLTVIIMSRKVRSGITSK